MGLIHRQRNYSSTQVGLHYCTLQDMIDKRKQSNFSYAPLKRQRWRHLNVFAAYERVSNTFFTCSIQLYRMNSSLPKSRTDYVLTDTSLIGLHTYRGCFCDWGRHYYLRVNTLPRRWLLSSSYSNEFMKAFGSSQI
mmetsp:Transcript_6996/g.15408  ORF Transcript_6996/g.15408 Transcript_6996/m.15408 type:complete len:136 (+) Transcript_6996:563-970(+)